PMYGLFASFATIPSKPTVNASPFASPRKVCSASVWVFEPAFLLHQSRSPDCFLNILSILTYSNIVSRFKKGKCEPINNLFALRRKLLLLPLLALPGVRVNAQSPPSTAPHDELFRTIA